MMIGIISLSILLITTALILQKEKFSRILGIIWILSAIGLCFGSVPNQ